MCEMCNIEGETAELFLCRFCHIYSRKGAVNKVDWSKIQTGQPKKKSL